MKFGGRDKDEMSRKDTGTGVESTDYCHLKELQIIFVLLVERRNGLVSSSQTLYLCTPGAH